MNILIFVWIGDFLPPWALLSLKLNSRLLNRKIILLCSNKIQKINFLDQFYYEDFYTKDYFFKSFYNQKFSSWRDGFWIKTSERFFILNQFVKKYNIDKFYHAEIDNLIFDLSNLSDKLDLVGSGFFCPQDSSERGIASLIYINNLDSLDVFCKFYQNMNLKYTNDMIVLGSFLNNSSLGFPLPTENSISSHLNSNSFGGIFDAASMGQYLFGIELRNSFLPVFNGYVNSNSHIDYDKALFNLDLDKMILNLVYLKRFSVNIYNLHIHSKNFYLFSSKLYERIIFNSNNNKKSFIGWNLPFLNVYFNK